MGQIVKREDLPQLLNDLKTQGKTVVTTNGCFDILHVGHVRYLQKNKNFCRQDDSLSQFRCFSKENQRAGSSH